MGRPPKPADSEPTKQLTVRFPPAVHEAATERAKYERRSLNDWIIFVLEERLGLRPSESEGQVKRDGGKKR